MTKIHVANDLHLEFDDHVPGIKLGGGDILLLPGDVCVASYLTKTHTDRDALRHQKICKEFFFDECAKYDRVYYVMGNHEHYHGVFDNTLDILRDFLEGTNVTVLEKDFVKLNDKWTLYGTTLWTDFNNNDWFAKKAAKDCMNDFTIIRKLRKDGIVGNFVPDDAYEDHKQAVFSLETGIYEPELIDRPTIVMTHHAPCHLSIHPRFNGNMMNYTYYTDLSETILNHPNIKYWLHGHTHDSFDYMVGDCRVVCNPRGYVPYGLNKNFREIFEFEIA